MKRVIAGLMFVHRYLGLAFCLIFVTWFASGIVMVYKRMPEYTAEERLARMPVLDAAGFRMTPAQALDAASLRLLLEAPLFAGKRRPRRPPRLGRHGCFTQQLNQPRDRIVAIEPLRAMPVRRDHDLALGGQPRPGQPCRPRLHARRQRR